MTSESIGRLRTSFDEVSARPGLLAALFYGELFASAPHLRPLFPLDMTLLEGHFEATIALVIRNLGDVNALQGTLAQLGMQHVHWGAKPEDYFLMRDALVRAVRDASPEWDADLESDWRGAITAIAVTMLQGAAVHAVVVAEQMDSEP